MIRKAKLADKVEITRLYHKLYPERKRYLKELLPIEKFNAKSLFFVSEEKKSIVGFIWSTFINYGNSRVGYVEDLFVKKEYRNKGIGTSLVRRVIRELKKLKVAVIYVPTEKGRKEAIKIYRNLGFRKDSNQCWFYLKTW